MTLFNHPDKLFFIAGPCVIESESLCLTIAESLAGLASTYGVDVIFKASYDKANRTSASSFRGLGRAAGLKILAKVKQEFGLPLLTDIHTAEQAAEAAAVVDVLQIPAFLCRQTDLLQAARATGAWVNVKKGQFVAPEDMRFAIEKAGEKTMLTERGTFFGYHRLVVDFTGLAAMSTFGKPVIFDATHSVQQPSSGEKTSGGDRRMVLPLARAAIAVGVKGLFFEVHPDPTIALCDGPNTLFLNNFERAVPLLIELSESLKNGWDM